MEKEVSIVFGALLKCPNPQVAHPGVRPFLDYVAT